MHKYILPQTQYQVQCMYTRVNGPLVAYLLLPGWARYIEVKQGQR